MVRSSSGKGPRDLFAEGLFSSQPLVDVFFYETLSIENWDLELGHVNWLINDLDYATD